MFQPSQEKVQASAHNLPPYLPPNSQHTNKYNLLPHACHEPLSQSIQLPPQVLHAQPHLSNAHPSWQQEQEKPQQGLEKNGGIPHCGRGSTTRNSQMNPMQQDRDIFSDVVGNTTLQPSTAFVTATGAPSIPPRVPMAPYSFQGSELRYPAVFDTPFSMPGEGHAPPGATVAQPNFFTSAAHYSSAPFFPCVVPLGFQHGPYHYPSVVEGTHAMNPPPHGMMMIYAPYMSPNYVHYGLNNPSSHPGNGCINPVPHGLHPPCFPKLGGNFENAVQPSAANFSHARDARIGFASTILPPHPADNFQLPLEVAPISATLSPIQSTSLSSFVKNTPNVAAPPIGSQAQSNIPPITTPPMAATSRTCSPQPSSTYAKGIDIIPVHSDSHLLSPLKQDSSLPLISQDHLLKANCSPIRHLGQSSSAPVSPSSHGYVCQAHESLCNDSELLELNHLLNLSTAAEDESILNCPVCLGDFCDPRMLPCTHTFCHECLLCLCSFGGCSQLEDGDLDLTIGENRLPYRLKCPVCRFPCILTPKIVDRLPKNRWINGIKATAKEIQRLSDDLQQSLNVHASLGQGLAGKLKRSNVLKIEFDSSDGSKPTASSLCGETPGYTSPHPSSVPPAGGTLQPQGNPIETSPSGSTDSGLANTRSGTPSSIASGTLGINSQQEATFTESMRLQAALQRRHYKRRAFSDSSSQKGCESQIFPSTRTAADSRANYGQDIVLSTHDAFVTSQPDNKSSEFHGNDLQETTAPPIIPRYRSISNANAHFINPASNLASPPRLEKVDSLAQDKESQAKLSHSNNTSSCRARVIPRTSYKFLERDWFAPGINREQAEEILGCCPNGTFLIRDSISVPGSYVLSLLFHEFYHMKIDVHENGLLYLGKGAPTFNALQVSLLVGKTHKENSELNTSIVKLSMCCMILARIKFISMYVCKVLCKHTSATYGTAHTSFKINNFFVSQIRISSSSFPAGSLAIGFLTLKRAYSTLTLTSYLMLIPRNFTQNLPL